ncbi:hypothetical protein GCM10007924_25220 [Sneathiella chinensis]|uniref:PAAR motif-containing protein n=1 Tax=Sneathiella chinensis TaxID=349750 RepID=A0ABQ5U9W7_9PROT|nr:hypothetical protein GCM10007924_25220 [Sneathiella chinensis]
MGNHPPCDSRPGIQMELINPARKTDSITTAVTTRNSTKVHARLKGAGIMNPKVLPHDARAARDVRFPAHPAGDTALVVNDNIVSDNSSPASGTVPPIYRGTIFVDNASACLDNPGAAIAITPPGISKTTVAANDLTVILESTSIGL